MGGAWEYRSFADDDRFEAKLAAYHHTETADI